MGAVALKGDGRLGGTRGTIMAGPAEVEFPGKKKQKIRMRGTKRASDSVQKRLRKNLNVLLEEPHSILPTLSGRTSRGFGRPNKMKSCLKDIEKVINKREDRTWLSLIHI